MFTEWMVLCRRSAFARTLTYVQIPEYFVWNNSSKVWTERKKGKAIGRIIAVHPSSGDRYMDNDVEWIESMSEAARSATPFQLRDMFVTFLNHCFVASPK
ncbi:unnamed protein product, partial [Brassica oleracea var. botrytis]